ncbi:hypothetical protein J4050_09560 [Winogradskyella sp. DF17]|uniref:DUF1735 domain-containing protein n=1 Tax=Winogradskyella pelagia TaxID=2819984 RepID=A0ABS3T5I6_9FLAO|nr:hypothetical protein [Winogradskyella sp. DF17]MBO3116995.1 hypothetical protein [Winogradskyella sp. DF17]
MKNRIYYILAVVLVALNYSCGDFEPVIYDGVNGQTLAAFDGAGGTLEVLINDTGELEIGVSVSTLSSEDRQIAIEVLTDSEDNTATPGQYDIPATVTIPADTYFGSFTVTGIDDELTTDGVNLILGLDPEALGNAVAAAPFNVRIVEICPVEASFMVGDYTINQISGGVPAAGNAPFMGNGTVVTLVPGAASTERVFNVKFYPTFGFSNPPVDFSFSLSCGETVVNGILDGGVSGVGCGSSIPMGPGATNGVYDTADDTFLTLVTTEDVGGASCGTEAQTVISLTKN